MAPRLIGPAAGRHAPVVEPAPCGVTTVEEGARRFQGIVDADTLADCLGRLDGLAPAL